MRPIGLDVGLYLRLKVTIPLKKLRQRGLGILDVNGRICASRRIVGDLQQTRVRVPAIGPREGKYSEVGCRLTNQYHANSVGLWTNFELDFLDLSAAL